MIIYFKKENKMQDQALPSFPQDLNEDQSITRPPISHSGIHHFKFHGNASEYFGIWIVNILLTIITLSLYAPWAKVRRLRYFYGNTEFLNVVLILLVFQPRF